MSDKIPEEFDSQEENSNFHPDSILSKGVRANKPTLSRRDFLKVAAISMGAAASVAAIPKFPQEKSRPL